MNLTSKNVNDVFIDCLFEQQPEDISKINIIEGVMMKVGFDPVKLEKSKEHIVNMLNQLPDDFQPTGGAGMTFLNACVDNKGNLWGQHQDVDRLLCLGLAINRVSYLFPKEMWSALPGSMPYFGVKAEN